MIIDGRKMASEVLARAKARAQKLARQPKVVALVASDTPATRSYLAMKAKRAEDAGCMFETRALGVTFADADAVIVQLPVPVGIHQKEVCDAIPLAKDADVLGSAARERFEKRDEDALLPPVVGAIRKILEFGNVEIAGKKTVVIGRGFLVGAPAARWLRQQGSLVKMAMRVLLAPQYARSLPPSPAASAPSPSPFFSKTQLPLPKGQIYAADNKAQPCSIPSCTYGLVWHSPPTGLTENQFRVLYTSEREAL